MQTELTLNDFRAIALSIALLLALPIAIEPSWQNMAALLGATGLALGFALKDYVSSLIAGVVSAFERPYRPGDWIEIDGIYGEVVHVGMRSVALVTPDDDYVTIPHLKLWNTAVKNANNGSPRLQCSAVFHVHPDHDARQAQVALEDVALTSAYLQILAPVLVLVRELEWGTQYRIRAYPVDPRQQFRFTSDLTVRGRAVASPAPRSPSCERTPTCQTHPQSAPSSERHSTSPDQKPSAPSSPRTTTSPHTRPFGPPSATSTKPAPRSTR